MEIPLVTRYHHLLLRYIILFIIQLIVIQVDVQTNVHANVLARALGCEDDSTILKQYDMEIMAMIEEKQITPKVRNHVVREVAARMLDHCLFPTKNQYQVVSTKIIQQFPVLADAKVGTGYVSNPVSCIVIILVLLIDSNQ